MAQVNTFMNEAAASVGTTLTTVYTTPSSTSTIVLGCQIANTSAAQVSVDVKARGTYILKGAPIPSGGALAVLDGKLVLTTGQTFQVLSSDAASVDVIMSGMEQTDV